jgi:hypothetical protein
MAMVSHGLDKFTPEVQKRKSLIPKDDHFQCILQVITTALKAQLCNYILRPFGRKALCIIAGI